MLTNPKEFDVMCGLIPKPRRENIWYFPIRQNTKVPEVPKGTILKNNLSYRLSRIEADKRLHWGSNIGIYALSGGLMFVDFDTDEMGCFLASKEYRDQFNETFTVLTPSKGIHLYYLNDGEYPNQNLYEGDIQVGELRTDWFYVVAVGSFKNEPYKILKESSINKFEYKPEMGIRVNGEPITKVRKDEYKNGKHITKEEYLRKTKDRRRIKL